MANERDSVRDEQTPSRPGVPTATADPAAAAEEATLPQKAKWNLSREAFEQFLSRLDTDREQAGERYEKIRRKLIKFFTWENCPHPEDHADEAINRLAKRIGDGEAIQDLNKYLYGVAHLILLETLKERQREQASLEQLSYLRPTSADTEADESALVCLKQCLERLSAESRELILQYYQEEKSARIESRQRLAEQLHIPLNALRNRTLRLREKLEHCVGRCLTRQQQSLERDESRISATDQMMEK